MVTARARQEGTSDSFTSRADSAYEDDWDSILPDDAKPAVTAAVKPAATADVKPAVTADVKPVVTVAVKPAATVSVKPAVAADVRPRPSDFGLTEAQTKEVENSGGQNDSWKSIVLLCSVAIFLWGMHEGWGRPYNVGTILGGALISAFLGYMAAIPVYFTLALLGVFEAIKESDPTRAKYQKYRQALTAHERRLAEEAAKQRDLEAERERERRRKEIRERQKKQEYWFSLSGYEFEQQLADVYSRLGYSAVTTPASGDEGVDIRLSKGGEKIIVQCKAHRNPIGPAPVRELYGTLLHEKADRAIFFALAGYTEGAKTFAEGKPIELRDVSHVLALQAEAERASEAARST